MSKMYVRCVHINLVNFNLILIQNKGNSKVSSVYTTTPDMQKVPLYNIPVILG